MLGEEADLIESENANLAREEKERKPGASELFKACKPFREGGKEDVPRAPPSRLTIYVLSNLRSRWEYVRI